MKDWMFVDANGRFLPSMKENVPNDSKVVIRLLSRTAKKQERSSRWTQSMAEKHRQSNQHSTDKLRTLQNGRMGMGFRAT